MASLTDTTLDMMSIGDGSAAHTGTGHVHAKGFFTETHTIADETAYRFCNAGQNLAVIWQFFGSVGAGRPQAVWIGGFGLETVSNCTGASYTSGANWAANDIRMIEGAYNASSPTYQSGTDGYITFWVNYPQGGWLINRSGSTIYYGWIATCQG